MSFTPVIAVYVVAIGVIWALYIASRRRFEARSRATKEAAAEAGLLEPASLHPKVDPAKCLGCGACVRACPEGDILGMRSEEHTSELQSQSNLVCRLLLEKKKKR